MAFETPPHTESFVLEHDFHVVDSTVARNTADALLHVRSVVEVHIVRQVVDPNPFNWLSAFPACAYRGQFLTLGVEFRVAIHTSLGGWNCRVFRVFDRGVTVTTVDCQLSGVERVAERDRLLRLIADVGCLRGKAKVDDEECIKDSSGTTRAKEILDFVRPRRKVKQAHFCSP